MVCPSADADGGRADGAVEVAIDGAAEVAVDGAAEDGADGPVDGAAEVRVDSAAVAVDGVVDANARETAGHGGPQAGATDGPVAKPPATTGGCGCAVSEGGSRAVGLLAIAAFIVAGRRRSSPVVAVVAGRRRSSPVVAGRRRSSPVVAGRGQRGAERRPPAVGPDLRSSRAGRA